MSGPRFVNTLEALDEALDSAAVARAKSDDAFRQQLSAVMFTPAGLLGKMPADPASAEYRSAQLRLYEHLTQHSYEVAREETKFDRAHLLRWPFPYVTRSAATVGSYLMSYGQIIKEMNLPPGARILEMGSGYGPLTYQLASMGYHVTCADISETLLEYVRTRCANLPGPVDTICCDMNDFSIPGLYDAVVFFESFHHVLNHADLIGRIGACLDDNGILVFAGEPIVPTDSKIVPYPWGLRMDGMSLWAIRRDGWLELGFRVDYFSELLRAAGWSHKRVASVSVPGSEIWICRSKRSKAIAGDASADEPVQSWQAIDAQVFTRCGRRDDVAGTLSSQGEAGYLSYGPYMRLDAGLYEILWEGSCDNADAAFAEIACGGGQNLLRKIQIATGQAVLARARFYLREPVDDIEFRIQVGAADVLTLKRMELRRLPQLAPDTKTTDRKA